MKIIHSWENKNFSSIRKCQLFHISDCIATKKRPFDIKVSRFHIYFAESFLFLVSESAEETTWETTAVVTDHSTLVLSTSDCVKTEVSPAGRGMKSIPHFSKAFRNLFFLAAPTIA